jgi:hypothetical protein
MCGHNQFQSAIPMARSTPIDVFTPSVSRAPSAIPPCHSFAGPNMMDKTRAGLSGIYSGWHGWCRDGWNGRSGGGGFDIFMHLGRYFYPTGWIFLCIRGAGDFVLVGDRVPWKHYADLCRTGNALRFLPLATIALRSVAEGQPMAVCIAQKSERTKGHIV